MDKDDVRLSVLVAIFTFLCGILVGFLIPIFFTLLQNDASESFNGSCTVITSDKTYENCLIIDHDKENDFVEFKYDGKDIYVRGQYTIIKDGE